MARDAYKLQIIIDAVDRASKTLKKQERSLKHWAAANKAQFKAVGLAAGGALAALGYGAYKAIKAFDKQQKAEKQLNAVLKSTHHAAGLTAEEVKKMAASFQKATTYGDEEVLAGQNMLLTFTKIGKDIFPAATQTMLDMSVALGQDMKQSAIQLGKALNDPILGMTNLRRVGVNFSDAQVEVVKQMVKTGDVAAAQRLILKELHTEFGGSAEAARDTFGGALKALMNVIGDLMEKVGAALIPVLMDLLKTVQNNMPFLTQLFNIFGAIAKVVATVLVVAFKGLLAVVKGVIATFDILGTGIAALFAAMTGHFKAAKMGWEDIKNKVVEYGNVITGATNEKVPKLKQVHIDAFKAIDTKIAETGDKYKTTVETMKTKTDEAVPTIEDTWKKSLDDVAVRFGRWKDLIVAVGQATTDLFSDSFYRMMDNIGDSWKDFTNSMTGVWDSFKKAVIRGMADIAAKATATKLFQILLGSSLLPTAAGAAGNTAAGNAAAGAASAATSAATGGLIQSGLSSLGGLVGGGALAGAGLLGGAGLLAYLANENHAWGKTKKYAKDIGSSVKKAVKKLKFWQEGGLANGWGIVGEEGPELVYFPQAARVHNAETTREMLAGNTINVYVSGNTISNDVDLDNLADTIGERIIQAVKSERNF